MANPILVAHGVFSERKYTMPIVSVPQTLSASLRYPCNTTVAAFELSLPNTPLAGAEITFFDYARTFGTNSLTINGNGNMIMGLNEKYEINTVGAERTFYFMDATRGWSVR